MEVVRWLMDAGASIEVANKDGSTPVYLACRDVSIYICDLVSLLHHDSYLCLMRSIRSEKKSFRGCVQGHIMQYESY